MLPRTGGVELEARLATPSEVELQLMKQQRKLRAHGSRLQGQVEALAARVLEQTSAVQQRRDEDARTVAR
jgi:hypothetical protein